MLDTGLKRAGERMSYRNLDTWHLAREAATSIHRMTLDELPKFEMFEEGSQIRRSIKSVSINIVEGYGRRRYKQEFIRYLTYALASCDETAAHLEMLFETGSLTNSDCYEDLRRKLEILGKKLNSLIQSVEEGHISEK